MNTAPHSSRESVALSDGVSIPLVGFGTSPLKGEHGFVVIPRSRHPERIAENFAIFDFELTGQEIRRLDALGA